MRLVVLLATVAYLAGCTGVSGPCAPWDESCATAALFAEEALGSDDWDAVAAAGLVCDEAPAMRGFVEADRCWLVRLEGVADGPATSDAVVVLTRDGDLVVVQETITPR
jgi:hypothetical protein